MFPQIGCIHQPPGTDTCLQVVGTQRLGFFLQEGASGEQKGTDATVGLGILAVWRSISRPWRKYGRNGQHLQLNILREAGLSWQAHLSLFWDVLVVGQSPHLTPVPGKRCHPLLDHGLPCTQISDNSSSPPLSLTSLSLPLPTLLPALFLQHCMGSNTSRALPGQESGFPM